MESGRLSSLGRFQHSRGVFLENPAIPCPSGPSSPCFTIFVDLFQLRRCFMASTSHATVVHDAYHVCLTHLQLTWAAVSRADCVFRCHTLRNFSQSQQLQRKRACVHWLLTRFHCVQTMPSPEGSPSEPASLQIRMHSL